jgi:uncharacterized protein YdgA (DUF945 family)
MGHKTLSQKCPTQKMASGMVQAVEYLTSKQEALSLNPSTAKKREEDIFFKWEQSLQGLRNQTKDVIFVS